MSIDVYTYVGPFLKCKRPVRETLVSKGRFCTNELCQRPAVTPDGFCPRCGSKVAARSEKKTGPVSLRRELRDKVNEALYGVPDDYKDLGEEYDYFFPNVRRPGQPRDFVVDNNVFVLDIAGTDTPRNEAVWFAAAFGKEVIKATDLYGLGNVDVGWGVVRYCN